MSSPERCGMARLPIAARTAAVLLLSLAAASCRDGSQRAEQEVGSRTAAGAASDADRAPDFSLPDLRGQQVRLSDFRGKVVLLDFWATWCGPCRMEVPHFKELTARYGDRGFTVLAVALDETGAEVVRPFVERQDIRYPVVIGDQYTAGRYGGVSALPTTFLIDREGRVVKRYVGYRDLGTFEEDIRPLL